MLCGIVLVNISAKQGFRACVYISSSLLRYLDKNECKNFKKFIFYDSIPKQGRVRASTLRNFKFSSRKICQSNGFKFTLIIQQNLTNDSARVNLKPMRYCVLVLLNILVKNPSYPIQASISGNFLQKRYYRFNPSIDIASFTVYTILCSEFVKTKLTIS